jgi:hypothetical protein
MMKMLELQSQLVTAKSNHEAKFNELKGLISGIAYQQTSLLQTLQLSTGEANTTRDKQTTL